jgi:DNA polymerase-1
LILNFQDQGTGAEIALRAIADLPEHLAAELVNSVHDELVFEMPAELAGARAKEIERVMVAAADRVLRPFMIPTEVEVAVGYYWIH